MRNHTRLCADLSEQVTANLLSRSGTRRSVQPLVIFPALARGWHFHFRNVNRILVRVEDSVHSDVMPFVTF
jgi:hypothetical protein